MNIKKISKLSAGVLPQMLAIGFWGPIVPQSTGSFCDFLQLVQNIINFLTTISVPLAIGVIVYGGFRLMAAGGSEEGVKAGKSAIFAAVTGLVIVFGAWIIINTILQVVGASGASSWGSLQC
jgi:hypothetical protein